jgi:hypothetical protein
MILTNRHLAVFVALSTLLHGSPVTERYAHGPSPGTPVLLELFTSEGCSSCPAADKLLEEIDREQPINGADLIVLSEHVDYWNHLGWADPYSSPAFSVRQQWYGSRFSTHDIYTPELVVDGTRSLVGSDWPKAENAIKESVREAPKIPINLAAERKDGKAQIHVQVASNSNSGQAPVYLVLAYDRVRSQVARGENAGRDLSHTAVAYSMQEIATLQPESKLDKTFSASLPRNSRAEDTRVIVFVRKSDSTRIIGVAKTRL